MNRCISLFFFTLLLGECSLLAEQEIRLEFRSAAFFHSSKLFRKIYGTSSGDYQLQASSRFQESLEIWTNLDWFSKSGRSVGLKDPTNVKILNYSLGINYVYALNYCSTLYLGIGPSLATIWINNKPRFEKHEHTSRVAIGGVIKTGLYYTFSKRFYLNLFIDYLYQPVHFQRHVDIGGYKIGAGIGAKF